MENLNTLKQGEHFTYNGLEWICLDYLPEYNGVLAMTAQVWKELPFDTDRYNNWQKSSLRRVLNNDFLEEKLNKKHLVPFRLDLLADNGDDMYCNNENDYVGILSCDQYRKYRKIVPHFDEWMWTCTPWNCSPSSSNAGHVRFVYPTGNINNYYADSSYGVAPACIFSSEHLKLCRQAHLVEVDDE